VFLPKDWYFNATLWRLISHNILQANTLCKKAAISTHSKPIYFQIVVTTFVANT
jgi:hypothetical protein